MATLVKVTTESPAPGKGGKLGAQAIALGTQQVPSERLSPVQVPFNAKILALMQPEEWSIHPQG